MIRDAISRLQLCIGVVLRHDYGKISRSDLLTEISCQLPSLFSPIITWRTLADKKQGCTPRPAHAAFLGIHHPAWIRAMDRLKVPVHLHRSVTVPRTQNGQPITAPARDFTPAGVQQQASRHPMRRLAVASQNKSR